jgi:hypothetical protein
MRNGTATGVVAAVPPQHSTELSARSVHVYVGAAEIPVAAVRFDTATGVVAHGGFRTVPMPFGQVVGRVVPLPAG